MELPTRHFAVRDQQMKELQKDVWSDEFVKATYVNDKGKQEQIYLRYRGGHTRDYPKKSYEIVRRGKTVHFNAEYDDPSMIRNALSFRFFRMIGVPSPRTRHCLLYLNDELLGPYLEIEAVDKHFFNRRGIPVQSLVYASNDDANFSLISPETNRRKQSLFDGYRLKIGNSATRQRIVSFVRNLNGLGKKDLYTYLNRNLDINNYLHWLAGAVLTGNYDGFDQNYALYRHRTRNVLRIIPWDYEGTWGRNCYGKICRSDLVAVTGHNKLTKALLNYSTIRKKYKGILEDILEDTFTTSRLEPIVYKLHDSVAPHISRDTMRKWSYSVFNGEPDVIMNYIRERRDIVYRELKNM